MFVDVSLDLLVGGLIVFDLSAWVHAQAGDEPSPLQLSFCTSYTVL